ncbi:MAG: PDZ domain-containing protein [Polyangiaceae bacterium]|nr:PDZ domain-containing protein [Polyangiaceae bacterium]
MRILERVGRVLFFLSAIALACVLAGKFGAGSLWRGFEPAVAGAAQQQKAPYDLTRLEAVNETLKYIRKKYVDPGRIKPPQMLLSALNYIQRDVAQVIVHQQEGGNEITVQVEGESKSFRVDNIQGPWDVAARLREVFAFLQKNLEGSDVDLRELEYAACNGMLHTLDPHSTFLSPEAYRDMNVTTSGAFGGLGIVISVRDQQLTVMKPMPGTPAERAGLKKFDRIVKIENESTLNMPLDDAVRRLRGEPGSKITVWIVREGDGGWAEAKPFPLTREVIKMSSVDSKQLDGNVGYVKIKNFQSTTFDEVVGALDGFKQKGAIKGLVLDLRGNPGGLLDQAVKIADLFLTDGTIVATVGASEGREERKAASAGTEPGYPIVVLVNGSSASASEILAGALKNLERGLIVGQQTFGKGSVQLVFPEITPEKAALKLTIAEYLTPNDVSIQGVGITPDVELDAMTVDPLEMDLTVQKDTYKEKELFASLESQYAAQPGKPDETVRYQFTSAEREIAREQGSESDDDVQNDFPVRFGRELAASMPSEKTPKEQLKAAKALLDRVKKDELTKVSGELEKLGVDWAAAPDAAPAVSAEALQVTVETSTPSNVVNAGDPMELTVKVKNNGASPVYRVRAQTESENGYFDAKELVFGRIAAGEEKSAKVQMGWCEIEGQKYASIHGRPKDAKRVCKIPMDAADRSDGVSIKFESEGGGTPATAEVRPTIRALPRPVFKYSYQIVDDRSGNGDGRVQRGEKVSMYLTVKNVGTGRSYETQANITNMSGDGLLLDAGRFDISNMKPGDVRKVAFSFDVAKDLADAEAIVSLSVGDRDLNEIAREKVKIPVEPASPISALDETRLAGTTGALLLDAPKTSARSFGQVPSGTAMHVIGRSGSFDKVQVDDARYAFVASSELAAGSGKAAAKLPFDDLYMLSPPELKIDASQLSTSASSVTIRGKATGANKIADLYGFVGSRKVFYQSNKKGADPKAASFEVDVPLKPGVNIINVFARENADSVTRRMIIVRRDSDAGALLKTPKGEDQADWLALPPP